jgi:hypothetical protein
MQFTYSDFDNALDYFEQRNFSEQSEKEFMSSFPNIFAYLTSNQFDTLTEDEFLILMFNCTIIMKVFTDKIGKIIDPDQELIDEIETDNWDEFEELDINNFEEKVIFMFGNEQEDIADYILSSFDQGEDEEDEDSIEIGLPAKEIIFITVKTVFDSLMECAE